MIQSSTKLKYVSKIWTHFVKSLGNFLNFLLTGGFSSGMHSESLEENFQEMIAGRTASYNRSTRRRNVILSMLQNYRDTTLCKILG